MASTLSQSDRLNASLDTWPDWQAEVRSRPTVVRSLDGFTNDNFLITAGTQQWSLRLNTKRLLPGIDRPRERQVIDAVSAAGVMDAPVYQSETCLVTRYFGGRYPDLANEKSLAAVGRLFRHIHRIETAVDDVLEPLHYAEALVDRCAYEHDTLARCLSTISDAYHPPEHVCLCHNDLSRENLIQTPDGLVAIDWEYARLGDPAFDVAVLVEMGALNDSHVSALLAGYEDEGDLEHRLPGARLLYALVDVLWWLSVGEEGAAVEARVAALKQRLSDS